MSFMNDALAKFKGAWASLHPETKGEIMQELGVPDGFNPFPLKPSPSTTTVSHDEDSEDDIIDAEFKEVRPGRKKEDLDDAFGV